MMMISGTHVCELISQGFSKDMLFRKTTDYLRLQRLKLLKFSDYMAVT